jgi:hypothetical protein
MAKIAIFRIFSVSRGQHFYNIIGIFVELLYKSCAIVCQLFLIKKIREWKTITKAQHNI